MSIRSVKNQYLGINAHLHSFWQGMGKWNRFHDYHIGHLMSALKERLLPMGYTAQMEESLQIRRVGEEPYRPEADILIKDRDPQRAHQPSFPPGNGYKTLSVAQLIPALMELERPYSAISIYTRSETAISRDVVAWVELLSPSNKRKSSDGQIYQSKRSELLRQGIVFIEIDYLHETPPTFSTLNDYSQRTHRDLEARPYRIVVLDPRPDPLSGPAEIIEFEVDQAIPTMSIPLNAGESLSFNFNAVYQKTFQEGFYGYDEDYSYDDLPLSFDRYSEADQTRIARRMVAVLEAARDGVDLESGPFPVKELSLAEALTQIETLKASL